MLRPNFILTLMAVTSICAACRADALPHDWSKSFGDGLNQYAPYVASDILGNAYVAGTFNGTIDLGGMGFWSAGSTDIFLAKFDSGGNHVWSRRFGDVLGQWVYGVAVDSSGNTIITGHYHGTVNFGGGPLSSAGQGDIFLAKYDPGGNHLWSRRFGDGWDQSGSSVAVDAAGNILLTGEFSGSVDFGGGPLSTQIEVPDLFVARFDPNGNHLWSQDFGDFTHHQTAHRIAVDGAGNAIVIGEYEGNVDFGGGMLPTAAAGQPDMFLVQFDPSGAHNWSHGFAATSWEMGYDLTIDSLDGVFVTGEFIGSLDLGGGPLMSAGGRDIFLARFDQGGNHIWSRRFGDAVGQEGRSVVADGAGNVYITGRFFGSVDFGGGLLTSAGSTDVYLAQFDLGGGFIWSQSFGDAEYQQGHDLAVDGAGNLLATGEFHGSVDFGGGALTCAGGTDIFVARFGESTSSGPHVTAGGYHVVAYNPPEWMVKVELVCNGPGDARMVSAQMGEDISWLRITDAHCFYGDIPEGASSLGMWDDSYTLVLLSGYPGGSFEVWLDVTYEDVAGSLFQQQLEVTLDPSTAGVTAREEAMRAAVQLLPNRPNPFNPSTSIPFELSASAHVSLRIYDIGGRLVRTLVDDRLAGDSYQVEWDGRDDGGRHLASGAYLYRLRAGERTLTRKLMLVQ